MARCDHDEAIRSASGLALHRDAARERHEVDERGALACLRPLHDHQALAGDEQIASGCRRAPARRQRRDDRDSKPPNVDRSPRCGDCQATAGSGGLEHLPLAGGQATARGRQRGRPRRA
jgi:hypothetical protein